MSVSEYELKERAVAPRVTLEQVNESIISEYYFTAADAVREKRCVVETLECLTFCVLVLENGFTVTGQSACADLANYKKDIGQRIARQDAFNKIWPLLGYELKTKLTMVDQAGALDGKMARLPGAKTYIGTKVIHAVPMTQGLYFEFREWDLAPDKDPSDPGYMVQYTDVGTPNVSGFTGYVSWSPKGVFEAAYEAIR